MDEYIDRLKIFSIWRSMPDSASTMSLAKAIYQTPAEDVVPVRHGRWIYGEDVDIQCSVCGADALTEGDYRQIRSDFCPSCGAMMDLEDESDETN